jgi:NADPH:quinone reductase-like Zn-dependent oxidoreductase
MKAAQISGYGGTEVMTVATDVPEPVIAEGQVLVRVLAASVNPFDIKVRDGMVRQMKELEFPAILGGDFAGIIESVGEGVTGIASGDEVYGQANALSGQGSFAEFTPVNSDAVALRPKSVDVLSSAAIPLTGVSALQALTEHLELKSGQKVLIHGGAGGIGSLAIQLAKHLGAYVVTTIVEADEEFVKGLGADEVIDYEKEDFATRSQYFDAVYDTIGGDTYKKSFIVLKPGGKIVSMVEKPDEGLMAQYGVTAISQFTRVTVERLGKLSELVDTGAIKPLVDKVYPIEEIASAFEYLKSGRHHGKVVIKLKN